MIYSKKDDERVSIIQALDNLKTCNEHHTKYLNDLELKINKINIVFDDVVEKIKDIKKEQNLLRDSITNMNSSLQSLVWLKNIMIGLFTISPFLLLPLAGLIHNHTVSIEKLNERVLILMEQKSYDIKK